VLGLENETALDGRKGTLLYRANAAVINLI